MRPRVRVRALPCVFLAGLVATTACSADHAEPSATTGSAQSRARVPDLPHLPDGVTDFYDAGCVAGRVPGCSLGTYSGADPLRKAKAIYDDFFRGARPGSVEGFGWEDAPDVPALVDTVRLPVPPWGSVDQMKSWMALRPDTPRFTRTDTRSNLEIFRELREEQPALLRDGQPRPFELYNARDFVPAALTHYQVPTPASDIMATNFAYRIVKQPWRMERALADCTSDPEVPCIDAFAALSDVDIGGVLDVRFLRWRGGKAQKSRLYRVVVVDSGHAIQTQATRGPGEQGTPYLLTNRGAEPTLIWRAEMSGSLSQQLVTGPGASGALLRYSSVNGTGDAATPEPGACTDWNDGNWKCAEDPRDGVTKTWKCTQLEWKIASWGCRIPAGVSVEPSP